MTNLDFDSAAVDIETVQRRARLSAHIQRAQTMLIAACLATLGVVAVAGTLLANLF